MARKLVPLEEAAKTLGISPDELNNLRENREIYGYRDGASWKFKPEDVERLAQELAERGSKPASDSSSLAVDLSDSDDEGDDIVLLQEGALGGSAGGSSTVIGGPANVQSPEDSDIKLSDVSGVELVGGGSSTVISKPKSASAADSEVSIHLAGEKDQAGSDVLPLGGSDVLPRGGSDVLSLSGSDVLPLDLTGEGSSGKKGPGSDLTLATEQAVGEGIDSDLAIVTGGSSGKIVGGGPGSDLTLGSSDDDVFQLQDPGGSAITLAEEGGSGPGSDITISPGDSGINLIDPSDSGISLEEPLELSSADDESSFDLSSDSSGDSSGTLGDSADFDSDAVMELQSEDEFLLTPLEESIDDESQDSGSQVIALDSDADFDDATPTALGSPDMLGGALLEPEEAGAGLATPDLGLGAAVAPGLAMAPGMVMASAREAPYSVWQVLGLSTCVLLLAMCGMMTYDLMRNMWSWEGAYTANSTLMDAILGMF
ncbi:MAG TPA: helix-turn-helix domain-containing protein [Pirellulales bacterium]|nr:helix-turn-helix domain-containing protein [Pirellulales bacterium]